MRDARKTAKYASGGQKDEAAPLQVLGQERDCPSKLDPSIFEEWISRRVDDAEEPVARWAIRVRGEVESRRGFGKTWEGCGTLTDFVASEDIELLQRSSAGEYSTI